MSQVQLAESDADVARLFTLLRELRPHIADEAELVARVQRQRASERGWRLAYIERDGVPVAAASCRILEHLAWGKVLYVDDLICTESHRGTGAANSLMKWMEEQARAEDCTQLQLDSGTQRIRAHHFYFRQGFSITSFHFGKKL
jgi:GNAT superfamily N-acetyltransferase